jgi:leucyl/phenylalanyl-tRNA---protein transferase
MNHLPPLDTILKAYSMGLFPMAESAEAPGFSWYEAPLRGVLPIEKLHVSRRLRQTVLRAPFEICVDKNFAGVVDGCAAPGKKRQTTWINRGIRDLFIALHEAGYAHSVECWRDDALAGGVYGLALGGVFCGESMFSAQRDASKVALVHLCARLWRGDFTLFDAQLVNPHLRQFGVREIPRQEYLDALQKALTVPADFHRHNRPPLSEKDMVRAYLAALPSD